MQMEDESVLVHLPSLDASGDQQTSWHSESEAVQKAKASGAGGQGNHATGASPKSGRSSGDVSGDGSDDGNGSSSGGNSNMSDTVLKPDALAHGMPRLPPCNPVGDHCPLLAHRWFVADIAKLAEQICMDDMPADGSFWTADAIDEQSYAQMAPALVASLRQRLKCRERPAFFMPEKLSHVARKQGASLSCEVSLVRVTWAVELQARYGARVLEWVDTGVGCEKQCCVALLARGCPQGRPVLVLCWRGSKATHDYLLTDLSLFFVPVPWAPDAEAEAEGRALPSVLSATSVARTGGSTPKQRRAVPSCTRGLWKAYAGDAQREQLGDQTPRARVRRAVERYLDEFPGCRLLITGHSLGGTLAQLCAVDLLYTCARVKRLGQQEGITVLSFASPRLFNKPFQEHATRLQLARQLHPLRINVGGDLIPHGWPRCMGGYHGVLPRLLVHPPVKPAAQGSVSVHMFTYRDDALEDDVTNGPLPSPLVDVHAHTSHAVFLSAEVMLTRRRTVPLSVRWPLVSRTLAGAEIEPCPWPGPRVREQVP